MAFKEQLEVLTVLLDPNEGATEYFNEAMEQTIDSIMNDATQLPDEGSLQETIPKIEEFISYFKSRHPLVEKYVRAILILRPHSAFAQELQKRWNEKFPKTAIAEPPRKKRKKTVKNNFENLISEIEDAENITANHLKKLARYARQKEYFELASENFRVYFDPDILDSEDEDLTGFYDLFLPENKDALRFLFEWLDSGFDNTFHLALNIISQVVPTGVFSFDSAILDKLFSILTSNRVVTERELFLAYADNLKDVIDTVFLAITYTAYQAAKEPEVITALVQFHEKIQTAQGIVNVLLRQKRGGDTSVNLNSTLFANWQPSGSANLAVVQGNDIENVPQYTATFNDKLVGFNSEQKNPSIFSLLGIDAQMYLNALTSLSSHPWVRRKFTSQISTYYLNTQYHNLPKDAPCKAVYAQYQEAANALLKHPLIKKGQLAVNAADVEKLIASNEDDDDDLNDLERLYKDYTKKQSKFNDLIDTKENFLAAIQIFGTQLCCDDQELVFMVAAKNNINLCLWEQDKDNQLVLSASTPYATSEPIHVLKQNGEYLKLKASTDVNEVKVLKLI